MATTSEESSANHLLKHKNRPTRRKITPKKYSCFEEFSGGDEDDDDDEKANRGSVRKKRKNKKTLDQNTVKRSTSGSKDLEGDLYSSLSKKNCSISDLLSQDGDKDNDEMSKYGANAFVCNVCGKVLRSKLTLLRHTISHSGSKPFLCSTCDRGFSSAVALKEHRALHDNTILYECQVCSKGFRQNSTYRRHLLIHSQTYKHSCDICDRKFSCKDYLKSHMKMHNSEKKYQCAHCNKAFTRLSDLNRHKILHSGSRPYKCDVCGMSFADSSSCRRHIKDHNSSSVQAYPCGHCKSSFKKPLLLKQHLMKKHKIKPSAFSSVESLKKTELCESSSGDSGCASNASEETSTPSTVDMCDDPLSEKEECSQKSVSQPEKDISCQDFIITTQFQPPMPNKQPIPVAIDYDNLFGPDIQGVDFSEIPSTENPAFQDITPAVQVQSCVGMGEMFCSDLQQMSTVPSSYSIAEEPMHNTLHLDYVSCPDFNSQAYYTWLSDFTELCKLLTFPIESDLFNKISQVHKSIADVLAEPLGILSNKANFKILMSISQDLLQVTNGHLNFIYEHLQE